MKTLKLLFIALAAISLSSCLGDNNDNNTPSYQVETETFENVTLPTGGNTPGVRIGQSYESSNGYVFQNHYTNEGGYEYNAGYTVSNNNDTKTAGYNNQYSVYSASAISGNKFLIYNPPYGSEAYIERKDGQAFYPYMVSIAPTTYTMLSVLNGDDYAKKFTATDSLTITFYGCDSDGKIIETKKCAFNMIKNLGLMHYDSNGWTYQSFTYLQPSNNLWMPIPLYTIGKVYKILIKIDSSDKSAYGVNTPQYLALDDFTTVTMATMSNYEAATK